MANMPALPKLKGLATSKVRAITHTNTMLLEISMERRKSQLTDVSSSFAKDMKIREGRENVPTNVFMPFASVSEIMFIRPAK